MRNLFLLPLFVVLTGCVAHLSQQQCVTMNWYNEGFNDGVGGKPPRDLTQAIQDCAQYHISINTTVYQSGWREGVRKYCTPAYSVGYDDGAAGKAANDILASRSSVCALAGVRLRLTDYHVGWQQGITSFCTYDNGTTLGEQGKLLSDVCPASLQANFTAGWTKGKQQFCSQPANAFALGKENKPYPAACTPELFVAFKSEYDRGAAIGQRISDLKNQIKIIDDKINNKVDQYDLQQDGSTYELGDDKSNDAVNAMNEVNTLVTQKQSLNNDLFNLQVMK